MREIAKICFAAWLYTSMASIMWQHGASMLQMIFNVSDYKPNCVKTILISLITFGSLWAVWKSSKVEGGSFDAKAYNIGGFILTAIAASRTVAGFDAGSCSVPLILTLVTSVGVLGIFFVIGGLIGWCLIAPWHWASTNNGNTKILGCGKHGGNRHAAIQLMRHGSVDVSDFSK